MEEKKYTLINIVAEDPAILIERNLSPEEALKRYFELKEVSDEISSPKNLIILIEGDIVRSNKKDLKKQKI